MPCQFEPRVPGAARNPPHGDGSAAVVLGYAGMVRPARPLPAPPRLADGVGEGRGLAHERGELVEHLRLEREREKKGGRRKGLQKEEEDKDQ